MSGKLPFTEKTLREWAGPRMFRDGQMLFSRGAVEQVSYEHPVVKGVLSVGPRGMRSGFRIASHGMVDNLCPCRDNQERGLICAHLVALGLELLRRTAEETRSERDHMRKHRDRVAQVVEGVRIRRVEPGTPGAVKALLTIELAENWTEQAHQPQGIEVFPFVEFDGRRLPPTEVSDDLSFIFPSADENVLCLLEDQCGGALRNVVRLPIPAFLRLLAFYRGHSIKRRGRKRGFPVRDTVVSSRLEMDLDQETGEILLRMDTRFPGKRQPRNPLYLLADREGWVFDGGRFLPLDGVLPPSSLREVYRLERLVIRREAVPAFLMTELPRIENALPVEKKITADLFHMTPAEPSFRLHVRGSQASLALTLYARYEDRIELVAGRADISGNFAIPDPQDLLSYRIRNMAAEKAAIRRLAAVGVRGRAGDTLEKIRDPESVLNFLGTAVPKLQRAGWQVDFSGRIRPFAEKAERVNLVVHVREAPKEDFFEVSYEYEAGTASISEHDIELALMKGRSYIEKDGKTLLFDADVVRQLRDLIEEHAVGEGELPGSCRIRSIYGGYVQSSLAALQGIELAAPPDWLERARVQNEQAALEPVDPSPNLRAELRPYQQAGLNWLRFLEKRGFCGILADEMGLGKTLQTLAWIQLERIDPSLRDLPVLVVCPTSLVENWREEAERFTPDLDVIVLHGTQRHREWEKVPEADLVITSYALLRRDIDRHVEQTYAVAILDEAQHIKNRSTQNAVAAKKLRAGHRLVLTGTPIENSVTDLWSIMDFLMPGYLGTHREFHERYEVPILAGGEEGEAAQDRLRRKIHPFLLRRLKKDVARDLPPKIERIAPCKLTEDQHKVYTRLLEESRKRIAEMVAREGFHRSRMEILRTLLRLRQTCCHIDLLRLEGVRSEHPSAKMDLFFELLDEALDSKHRVLVFSQFTSMLAILARELDARDIRYCYLDGSTKDRQDIVRRFNKDPSIPVFLMSLKAGGTGLNLTGADMVIHFDPWWNPAVENQATDRAHRIGQKRTVYSIKLVTRGTVEENVVKMQQRKQDLIDATLTTDEQIMQKLTWDDVRELLDL